MLWECIQKHIFIIRDQICIISLSEDSPFELNTNANDTAIGSVSGTLLFYLLWVLLNLSVSLNSFLLKLFHVLEHAGIMLGWTPFTICQDVFV